MSNTFPALIKVNIWVLFFIIMVNNTDWFSNIELSLHSWSQSHLIWVFNSFNLYIDGSNLLIIYLEFWYQKSWEIWVYSFLFWAVFVQFWCQAIFASIWAGVCWFNGSLLMLHLQVDQLHNNLLKVHHL